MSSGGRRPNSGAKKGSRRASTNPEKIQERRDHVFELSPLYPRPKDILRALAQERPDLLEGLRRPLEIIARDLKVRRREYAELVEERRVVEVRAEHIAFKTKLLRMTLAVGEQLPVASRLPVIRQASQLVDDITLARGLPLGRPFGPSPAEATTQTEVLTATGIVDPLTFATDARFCGLSDIPTMFPMQYKVLREFMSPTTRYRVLVLVCGMRSGKGVLGSIIAWYAVHELLAMEDPQAFLGLAPSQEIQILTVATSRAQAKNNVFKHITDRLHTGGEWFTEIRKQARIGALEVWLPKNIVIRCGHSRASSLVGGTSYVVILDELARFKDTEGRDNADDVYEKLSATTATFPEKARILVLTSPEWEGDKSMRLLEEALTVDQENRPLYPHMYPLQMPTWEANQNLSQDDLWERFAGAAKPTAFWRDFGAQPPRAVQAYYPDPDRWVRQADPERQHPFDELGRLVDWFRPCCDSRRFFHVDLGQKRDACGIAMAHKPVPGCPYHQTKGGPLNPKAKKVVLDLCGRFVPGPSGEIDFEAVRQLIRDLQGRGFKIKGGGVTLDNWQSVDFRQILRKEGFHCDTLSVDRDLVAHDTLQELINTDELSFYAHPTLIREAAQLQLHKGSKVDHPAGGSKDIIDAVAGAVFQAYKKGGRMAFVG